MSYYLLDTNICVHFLKDEYEIKERIESVGLSSCFLSEITIAELLFGVENSLPTRKQSNLAKVKKLQTLYSGRILGIGPALHEDARQKTQIRKMGRTVGEFDLLIGSTAIVHELILVTRNTRDFENLSGIILESWVDK
ncbi:PIN domain-containing protein [Arundinibacter roseus]|uniref:Type II toxin-antitoxin system VapC family toxin n=1 Tax=Arundinibacter roseus TaxID=2070510 RepID=A0A4V2X9H2_9BACT|nr:PIN domain-containing protein [Arundinibacter roseus]TDB63745.1 type II toxin-antitoxin system VapC family toxin [Arundinibacter roseus]